MATQEETKVQVFLDDLKVGGKVDMHLPGYAGYIPSMKSENLFGRTYGEITSVVRENMLMKGQVHTESVHINPDGPVFQNPYCFNYSAEERYNDQEALTKTLNENKMQEKQRHQDQHKSTVTENKVTVNVEDVYNSY